MIGSTLIPLVLNEHIPLEQGLRLTSFSGVSNDSSLNEHIPLEQGLRLICIYLTL